MGITKEEPEAYNTVVVPKGQRVSLLLSDGTTSLAFIGCMFAAHAQEKPSTGDLYDGLTRPLTFNRVIPPLSLIHISSLLSNNL